MIYVSHLLDDVDMRDVIERTGAGVESIEFSISENLDRLEEKIDSYEKRLEEMGCGKLVLHGPFLDLNPMAFDSLSWMLPGNGMSRRIRRQKGWGLRSWCSIPVMCRMCICS